ncbi:7c564bb7-7139-4a48-8fb5-7155d2503d47 [Thermothielavioides terrestris]|uniref:7c564bb7-7139-4a48-8fb5-7155d2503d47 n=1 Tax=Thermothielavioides terrestris TaxID=2587410 RepID=A0A446BYJ0_9PEZI|nr:7c564bb7-7139-4a48-8fb5-7155d2503d47 [Thermothielavioides terrestris]
MALPIAPGRRGHIVALEGPSELVSTQLRLLPTSRQILILPSLQHYMKVTDPEAPFDTRELIRRYHTAAQARHAEAQEFLRHRTVGDGNRLVFLHGGTLSARAACLSSIMEHETNGDIEEAYATFIRLASNDAAGLSSARSSCFQTSTTPIESSAGFEDPDEGACGEEPCQHPDVWARCLDAEDEAIEDPIIRAMRAADALDKETEFLQPPAPDMAFTIKLVDIPSRSGGKSSRRSKPPSPHGIQPQSAALFPDSDTTAQSVVVTPRRPPLRIRIPPPPQASACISWPQGQTLFGPRHRRSQTAESNLSPRQKPDRDGSEPDDVAEMPGEAAPEHAPNAQQNQGPYGTVPFNAPGEETEEQLRNGALPLLEDLVFHFTTETPDELSEFVFRRLSNACRTTRHSLSGPSVPDQCSSRAAETSHLEMEEEQEADDILSRKANASGTVMPWVRNDLVHGLPTPNNSPTLLETNSIAIPPPATRLYSISVGQETAVSIQNFLRSFLGSRFPLQDRRFSETAEFPADGGLWKHLECDGQVLSPAGESRLDLMLAVGAETGVKKDRLSEIVGQLEKLGFKNNGLSRSGRLDIRYLIANAMQAFTAQPLTKQTQSNPFADRTLLAALIIPHLETYLATHPDVRFLLIEYPAEHLPTILALQALIGTEMMKVVGIINSDVSSTSRSPSDPAASRRPSEGFRSLTRWGSRLSGAFVGPCSFSKANFLLASSATGFETAAFIAAIRESLISISDFYIPDRPLYKPPAPPPARKAHSKLSISLPAAGPKSPRPSQKEPSRVSVSTLVITPPSSPTDQAAPPQHPPSIAPSSVSSLTSPSKGSNSSEHRLAARRPSPPAGAAGTTIRWGEVNYAPPPHSPSTAAAPTVVTAPNTTNNTPASGGTRHRKQDSAPLSPGRRGAGADGTRLLADEEASDHHQIMKRTHHRHYHHQQQRYHHREAAAAMQDGYNYDDGGGRVEDDDEDDVPDEEERRLMPLFLRRRNEIDRGRSSKAFRWLGLA